VLINILAAAVATASAATCAVRRLLRVCVCVRTRERSSVLSVAAGVKTPF
jgi:hypothetical protein